MRPFLASALLLLACAGTAAAQDNLKSAQGDPGKGAAARQRKALPTKVYVKGQVPPGPVVAQRSLANVSMLVGGADSCATPDVIAGSGPFAFDNSTATTGAEGQSEAACNFFGSAAIQRDVWFQWTSTFTGNAELVSCNHTVDTKIAVYDGTACPTTPALACNDDYCGPTSFQSRVLFPAVSGQSYVIQLGLYPFTLMGGSGNFTINQVVAPPNDDCTSPVSLSGLGTFGFDNTYATTGTDGQNEPACNSVASTGIAQDVWYRWTSTVTGAVVVHTCGGAIDTKIAIYDGQGCPTAPALACNDDGCGMQSKAGFQAVAGLVYTIQLGLYPLGASGGAGSFTIELPPAHDACSAPFAILGAGTYAFDNTLATTSAEGQANANCMQFGNTAIANDLWFAWTSTFNGTAALSTCNSTIDTKIAVYDGAGCPLNAALACNDDLCHMQSRVLFPVVSGQTYTIQLGTFPNGGGAPGGTGTFGIQIAVPPANDGCAMSTAISGVGPHPFDNTYASTGVEGQNEGACNFFGSAAIASDVWFTWTATSGGLTLLSLCGGTTIDTKVAVYSGSGCPAAPAIACNEDACLTTSELCFSAIAGQSYTIQLGVYPNGGATPGAGTFTVTPQSGAGTNDDCSAPTVITGLGPHAYDNSTATTGCIGQDNTSCSFFGTIGIDNDLWFSWTAPTSNKVQVSLCAGGQDSKIALYLGAGCPSGPAIACDDDGCGQLGGEAQACFEAVAGQTYAIQLGNFPGAPGGPGTFTLSTVATAAGCQHDNGTSENSVGATAGGAFAWLQRYGHVGGSTTVASIATAYGTPLFPGGTPPPGTPVIAAIWDDPNDDGDPVDCVLIQQVPGVVTNVDNDAFDAYPLSPGVTVAGVFFVGILIDHQPGQFPAALDQNSCPASSNRRAWAAGNSTGTFDFANLGANDLPPTELDTTGLSGVWMLRADCAGVAGTAYCFGDGSSTACPCGNVGAVGHGCPSSVNAGGALLGATGSAVVGADTLVLHGSEMPTSSALYFQGSAQLAVTFGDGLRCVGTNVMRLKTKQNQGGASQYPEPGDPTISAHTGVPPGATRHYQIWYRNAATFCTAATFNLSNGLTIVWQ